MPSDEKEILSAFEEVLAKMDLPPDKMRTLRNCDIRKKWELVRGQLQFTHDQSITEPHVYLNQLRALMDKKSAKKKKKILAGDSPTKILKHLEISLRTNSIEWVRSFVSPENNGLQVVVDYLTHLQKSLVHPEIRQELSAYTSSFVATTSRGQQPAEYLANTDCIQPQTPHQQHHFNASSASSVSSMQCKNNNNNNVYASGIIPSYNAEKTYSSMKKAVVSSASVANNKNNPKASKIKTQAEIEADQQHIILTIFRTLLNNRFGIAAMFSNGEAIYCIVRSILHSQLRSIALALDMLSGILCLDDDGAKHELVLNCFSRLQRQYNEPFRFQILIYCFKNPEAVNIDYNHPEAVKIEFLSSVVKFINLLVHTTVDMNQRVALQYEFSPIDNYLDVLKTAYETCELLTHCNAYCDNSFNVHVLYEKSMRCDVLEDAYERLKDDCSRQKEEFQVLQANCFVQVNMINQQKTKLAEDRTELERQNDEKITTLSRDWREKERMFERQRNEYEKRIEMLEKAEKEIKQGLKVAQHAAAQAKKTEQQVNIPPAIVVNEKVREQRESRQSERESASSSFVVSAPSSSSQPTPSQRPVPNPPPPPPPPPPPSIQLKKPVQNGPKTMPPPPPPLGLFVSTSAESLPKKKIAKIESKMPMINWTALNPNQVKGTVFNNMNDEKLADVLDLSKLEAMFCLEQKPSSDRSESSTNHQNVDNTVPIGAKARGQASPNSTTNAGKQSLLSTKRLQNIAIIRRKIGKTAMEIMTAVHRFDFTALTSDQVPTTEETAKLQEYAKHNNDNFESLTAEDQFLAKLMDIERLERKLTLMKFMSDFVDNVRLLIPVLQKVTAASKRIQNADKFPKVIELILAVGNAMNGARRAPVYGFKIASLDSLNILKSPKDRNCTLMHILAEIITDKFPELQDFTRELKLAESAATGNALFTNLKAKCFLVNFETIVADVKEIDTKFEQILTEQSRKGKDESPESLNAFIESSSSQLISLKENFKLAQQSFLECSLYYGEGSSAVPDVFFSRIASFCKHFENALGELEAQKASEKRQEQEEQRKKSVLLRRNLKAENGQEKVIDELSQKLGQRNLNSFKDGDFEILMAELKETGFVAPSTITVKEMINKTNNMMIFLTTCPSQP
uniref:FH2 domain-containing protein n=1 Tax=Globodera pallida TaxID=36090 RepID=A0A183C8X8_GLOPA